MSSTALRKRTEQSMVQSEQARRWGSYLHLSALAPLFFPVLGVALPIVLWLWKKDEVQGLSVHARNMANGMLSYAGYSLVLGALGVVLSFFSFMLLPVALVLWVATGAVPLLAALKARRGEAWQYPLALPVLETLAGKNK